MRGFVSRSNALGAKMLLIWFGLMLALFLFAAIFGPTSAHAQTYTTVDAMQRGILCNGVNDEAAALQKAANALQPYQTLQLPVGTCLYSKAPIFKGKNHVAIIGKGKDLTTLKALNPLQSSVIVLGGDTIRVAGFTVQSIAAPPQSGFRTSDAYSKGIFVSQGARNVTISDVRVNDVRGAGILLCGVRGATVTFNEVRRSLADAFHITCGSRDVLAQFNLAEGHGDDSFASIGYTADNPNRNINFLDNVALNGRAGGCHFDTTIGGSCIRNKFTNMGVSCVAVSTDKKWSDGPTDAVTIAYNVLDHCVTRTAYDHGAISIYAANGGLNAMTNIKVGPQNLVSNARTPAFKAWGKARITAGVNDNTWCAVKKDIVILATAATITRSGNKLLATC